MKITTPSATAVFLSLGFSSCCFFNPAECCKVSPPGLSDSRSTDASAKAAADTLSSSIANGSIEGNVKTAVNQTFEQVDDDMALYLLLQAANCESARGNHASAGDLRESARLELLARRNQNASPVTRQVEQAPAALTPVEETILKDSPIKSEIISELPSSGASTSAPAQAEGASGA